MTSVGYEIGRGTPVSKLDLKPDQVSRLRSLSVTTVEELIGLIYADIEPAAEFLGMTDLRDLQADAYSVADSAILDVQNELRDQESEQSLGAEAPAGIDVEETASPQTFEDYASKPITLPGEPSSEIRHLDCLGPVRNQGSRGTCVAFAGSAVVECFFHRTLGVQYELSPQFLYWSAKQIDGRPNAEGTFLNVAMPTIVSPGIAEESTWPYNPQVIPGNVSHHAPPAAATANAPSHTITRPVSHDPRSSAEIRDLLDNGILVGISIPVYQNWYNNPATKTRGVIPMPLPLSRLEGGHAMCACGYGFSNDFTGGGYFIVRNSWGDRWAPLSQIQPGYGQVPFEYVDSYGWESVSCA